MHKKSLVYGCSFSAKGTPVQNDYHNYHEEREKYLFLLHLVCYITVKKTCKTIIT